MPPTSKYRTGEEHCHFIVRLVHKRPKQDPVYYNQPTFDGVEEVLRTFAGDGPNLDDVLSELDDWNFDQTQTYRASCEDTRVKIEVTRIDL